MDTDRKRGIFKTRPTRTDDVTFTINDEQFHCLPEVPGSVILDYSSALVSYSQQEQAAGALRFFAQVMTRSCTCDGDEDCETCFGTERDAREFTRFRAYIDDPTNHVHLTDLGELSAFLIEEYGKRPTTPSSGSAPGRSSKATGSKGDKS